MRKEKLPDALLAIFLAAVLIGFGAMTWIAGGRNIVSTAASAPARVGATAPFDVIKAAIKGVQSELNLSFFAKREWVAVRNVLVRLLGKERVPGSGGLIMVRLNDGLLAQLKNRLAVEDCRDVLTEARTFLDAMDTPLIFTYMPTKVLRPEEQLPLGARDNANAIADRFMRMLDDMGIDRLDARDTMLATGMKTTEMFYTTDVHWTIESAWAVYVDLAAKLNEQYGFEIPDECTDLGSYAVHTYEDYFLGSDGYNLGADNVGLDDFTTIIPTFPTAFRERSIDMDYEWEYREGDFTTAVMHMDHLEKAEGKDYSTTCYSAYGLNRAKVHITNELVDKGRVLIIKNSAGIPLTAFLATGVHEIMALDGRLLAEETMAQCIEDFQPDVVIYMYNFDFLKPDRLNLFRINPNPGLNN